MAEKRIRNLNPEEIECRVGAIMEQGITLLLYKNARVDQTILDEVFGICGWQRRHNMIGSELYCILSIWDDEKQQWVQNEPALILVLDGSCIRLLLFIFP